MTVVCVELCFFASTAIAITNTGSGLLDFARGGSVQCSGATPEQTIKSCQAALRAGTFPEARPKMFLALARAYEALHQTESALQAYDAVVALEPGNYEALAAGCWIRGLRNIELDRALNECQRALEFDPGDAQIVENRCLVHFRMGDYAKANADCSGAATFPPTAPRALYLRGLTKLRLGDGVGGNADIAAAKHLNAAVADDFAADGLAP